jgi:hypothetical protein
VIKTWLIQLQNRRHEPGLLDSGEFIVQKRMSGSANWSLLGLVLKAMSPEQGRAKRQVNGDESDTWQVVLKTMFTPATSL